MSNLSTPKKYKRILTFGVFDPLHAGHINLLEQAKKQGDYLIVIVARDSFIKIVKKREPVINEKSRREKITAVDCVDEVLFGDNWPTDDKYNLLSELKFNVVVLGYDQSPSVGKIMTELEVRGKKDVSVVRLKSFFPNKYKSSYFKKRLQTNN